MLLGIDIGTSATRATLVDLAGQPIATASHSHRVLEPEPGRAEHDAESAWWDEAILAMVDLAGRHPREMRHVRAIGLSTIGASIVPVDREGRALRAAILYGIDARAREQEARFEARLGAQAIRTHTGRDLSAQSVGPKIAWIQDHEPQVAARAHAYLPPTAFLSMRLCGTPAMDLHTALGLHPLFRTDTRTWDCEALDLCCRASQLAQVLPAGTPVGPLRAEVAARTGLTAGIPVCCGTADVLAEAVSCGAAEVGDTVVMYGSTLFVIHLTDGLQPRPPAWASYYPGPATGCLLAGTSTAGAAARWCLELLGKTSAADAQSLLHAARDVQAGTQDLVFLPYLRGERAPLFNPDARGVFFGLTAAHGPAHLYRAVLESIGFSLRHVLDELGLGVHSVRATGGGSELDAALRIAIDASGVEHLRPRHGPSAAHGAACLAGIGTGALQWPRPPTNTAGDERLVPGPQAESLANAYRLYREVVERNQSLFVARRASG